MKYSNVVEQIKLKSLLKNNIVNIMCGLTIFLIQVYVFKF